MIHKMSAFYYGLITMNCISPGLKILDFNSTELYISG